ncbi:ankyrin repeat domain-containing protein 29-like [Haliotis asinina]|uniref:ankyrin repeat domain-containing protein 29-like n=1 Tax=Haliotis asinina TaxID=109174 RepID=UPI0035319C1C
MTEAGDEDDTDLSEPEGVHRQTGDASKPKHTSGTVTDLRRPLADMRQELKATTKRMHRLEISHQKVITTPARRDARADDDLRDACRAGNLVEVKQILDTGRADVNSRDVVGRTPVMEAAVRGHRDMVKLLVGRGADVSLVTDGGNNILHYACMTGDRETVEFVLSLDAVDVNARNNFGETAADLARLWGHRQLSDLLVSRGAQ